MTTKKQTMIELETMLGDGVHETIDDAVAAAKAGNCLVRFDFNDVEVVVGSTSDAKLIYRDWDRGISGYLGEFPTVGPYPSPELTPRQLENDRCIQTKQDERTRLEQIEAKKERARNTAKLKSRLEKAGPIELSDPDGWQKSKDTNKDSVGSRVMRFAEEWARLMQVELADGKTIDECADDTFMLADYDGVTGSMSGCAMELLIQYWIYGEALKKWDQAKWATT